jgi:hypothetical protein
VSPSAVVLLAWDNIYSQVRMTTADGDTWSFCTAFVQVVIHTPGYLFNDRENDHDVTATHAIKRASQSVCENILQKLIFSHYLSPPTFPTTPPFLTTLHPTTP